MSLRCSLFAQFTADALIAQKRAEITAKLAAMKKPGRRAPKTQENNAKIGLLSDVTPESVVYSAVQVRSHIKTTHHDLIFAMLIIGLSRTELSRSMD